MEIVWADKALGDIECIVAFHVASGVGHGFWKVVCLRAQILESRQVAD
jgi:hypothetical protein